MALFVDSHPDSLQLIRKNLEITGLSKAAEVMRADALKAVSQLRSGDRHFDIIFADPPYAETKLVEQLISLLAAEAPLAADGIIALETDSKVAPLLPEKIQLLNRKTYGDTAVWLFTTVP